MTLLLPIDSLQADFGGELIRSRDAAYDAARKVWNGMIDKGPAVIARCTERPTSPRPSGPRARTGSERVEAAYGSSRHGRLAALKKKYDPTNFFHLNQNIKPLP